MQIEALKSWSADGNNPLLIAGPCSAETPEQFATTISKLKAGGISFYRAGIWKPRTRPNSFEGHGEEALKWLKDIKARHGGQYCIEVAAPKHVELALAYGVDVLWIGARSTVNPFTVQELADSLKGVDIPVMIKNPVNPDLALWLGAIERISKAGITKMAAIHRGFSSFGKSHYRNQPMWQIPIELKTALPDMPLICDPSHMGGRRELIFLLSQEALDLSFDGLMIESHPNPDEAWSDAQQQVTPEQLLKLVSKLKTRQLTTSNARYRQSMEELRHRIDLADRALLEALANRMRLVDQVGIYKKENNVSVLQLARWKEIYASRAAWAEKLQLDEDVTQELYRLIHLASIKRQTKIMDATDEDATT